MSVEMLVLVSLISVLSLVFYGAMRFLAGDNSINGMEYWFHQQVKYTVIGFLLMLLVCRIDYSILGKWSRQIAGGILLFILLSLVTGVQVYGRIYGLRVGPVMIPTFGMIWLYVPVYAAVLYTYRGRSYKGLTGLLIWTLLPVFLVLRLPGLNQAVMLLFICLLSGQSEENAGSCMGNDDTGSGDDARNGNACRISGKEITGMVWIW